MRTDPGLEQAVRQFIDEVGLVLDVIANEVPTVDPAKLRDDVVTEAFNLSAAFIDADGLETDDELRAFIATFASHVPRLHGASPQDVRKAGIVAGKREWLRQPSTLLGILVDMDARKRSRFARTYYERALHIAHTVASLDSHVSTTELEVIEEFREMVLAEIRRSRPDEPAEQGTERDPEEPGVPAAGVSEAGAGGDTDGSADEEELPPARPLDELLEELDGFIGLAPVKHEVKLVSDLIQVQNLRRDRGLPVLPQSRHLVFMGNPGTGKTTVARVLAQIYRTLGVVEKGHLVETDRSGLVAGYVGQTAIKVVEVFDRADQGVLLIDEAYALARGRQEDFGREAIDTIVNLVEDRRDRIVVIAAGYPDEMHQFIAANPGLRSRFPRSIHFPDYDDDELMEIFTSFGNRAGYLCDGDAEVAVRAWFTAQPRAKGFGNARLARNLFEAAVTRHASRVVAIQDPTDRQLVTLTAEDIPGPEEPMLADDGTARLEASTEPPEATATAGEAAPG